MTKTNKKKPGGTKMKTVAIIAATLAVFMTTYFAMAQNSSGNNIFLDSDQDGLTDQEEKALGTDPQKADTDGDGYSDGKEISSGYNPLMPAPGDQLFAITPSAQLSGSQTSEGSGSQVNTTLPSDPDNPNLTDEMIDSFLQMTIDKSNGSEDFATNPTFSQEDFDKIIQDSMSSANVEKNLPEIRDDEIKVLPPVDDKDLSEDEIKEEQKAEIEKYLSAAAFIFAQNSPFAINDQDNLSPNLSAESENLISAMISSDQEKIDAYAQKARASIDQMKEVEVPYVLKDVHKSALQLAIYTLDFKDDIAVNTSDPVKSLASLSSLQTIGESVVKLQEKLASIISEYGIDSVEIK